MLALRRRPAVPSTTTALAAQAPSGWPATGSWSRRRRRDLLDDLLDQGAQPGSGRAGSPGCPRPGTRPAVTGPTQAGHHRAAQRGAPPRPPRPCSRAAWRKLADAGALGRTRPRRAPPAPDGLDQPVQRHGILPAPPSGRRAPRSPRRPPGAAPAMHVGQRLAVQLDRDAFPVQVVGGDQVARGPRLDDSDSGDHGFAQARRPDGPARPSGPRASTIEWPMAVVSGSARPQVSARLESSRGTRCRSSR